MRTISQRRKKATSKLYNFLCPSSKTRYFDTIPLTEIFDICKAEGLVPLQEDNTEWRGFLCGSEGHASIPLGAVETKEPGMPDPYYDTSRYAIVMSWYRMPSGRWEVNGYLS